MPTAPKLPSAASLARTQSIAAARLELERKAALAKAAREHRAREAANIKSHTAALDTEVKRLLALIASGSRAAAKAGQSEMMVGSKFFVDDNAPSITLDAWKQIKKTSAGGLVYSIRSWHTSAVHYDRIPASNPDEDGPPASWSPGYTTYELWVSWPKKR